MIFRYRNGTFSFEGKLQEFHCPECDKKTFIFGYCEEHSNVSIQKSQIADQGLFAKKKFVKGDFICMYGTKNHNTYSDEQLYEIYGGGLYIYTYVDSDGINYDCALIRYPGAYCNDSYMTIFINNAQLVADKSKVWIEAIKDIEIGDEILISYGSDYWQVDCKPVFSTS